MLYDVKGHYQTNYKYFQTVTFEMAVIKLHFKRIS